MVPEIELDKNGNREEGVPYDVALFVKRYYEDELSEIENLSHLTIKALKDNLGNDTDRYVVEAGVYDLDIQKREEIIAFAVEEANKDNVANYIKRDKIPEYLIIPDIVDEYYANDLPDSISKASIKSNDGFVLDPRIRAIQRVPIKIVKGTKFYGLSPFNLHNPLIGGISVHHFKKAGRGTLGAIVNIEGDSHNYILSNWHVLSTYVGKLNDAVVQPAPLDRGRKPANIVAELSWFRLSERMDVALAKLNDGQDFHKKDICGNTIQGMGQAVKDMPIYKCGRMTGPETGRITNPCFSTDVFHEDYPNGKIYFREQILMECYSERGDSGSIIVAEETNLAVGLLFAGDTINKTLANPLDFNIPSRNIIEESHSNKSIHIIF